MRLWTGFAVAVALLVGLVGAGEGRAEQASCDPLAIDLTLTPQRTPNYPSLKETLSVQAARPARADVVMLGDSLLAGWSTDLPAAFPATAIYDFAVGGDRVPNVLWRLEKTDLSHLRPEAAVLLIGTNDLAGGTPACAVTIGIENIVGRLRSLWPEARIFVLTIPPRGADFHVLDAGRLEVNRGIGALADRIDGVHAVSIDDDAFTCGQYGKRPSADGQRLSCDNYVEDNLHFSTKGYVELARILRQATIHTLGKNLFQ
ncbi:GDSL-type esterase/lipase family protein [Pleomorphomonas oryzae]|uniref:GDSL-type esterase/lipase family protein n=1 Tax=Pleomorphomonas oryzae TaxID=261934 RepID=UPI00041EEAAE|nr:GDSL-type esterase/lipase family protein [Pleomorphomonas oryzae]